MSNQCFDLDINPADSPNCSPATLGDPARCLRCVKHTACGSAPCGPGTCILCPGQDPSDLPKECNGSASCPDGEQACSNGACPEATYCANGCCIGAIL